MFCTRWPLPYGNIAPPHSGLAHVIRAGGHDTTLKKLLGRESGFNTPQLSSFRRG